MSFYLFDQFPVIDILQDYQLRKPHEGDYLEFFECYTHPEITKFLPDGCIPTDFTDATRELRRYANLFDNNESIFWMLVRKDTDKVVGTCGLNDWDRYNKRVEISYEIHPNYWRRGLGQSIVKAAVDFAFNKMKVVRVQATMVTYNEPSAKLLEKVGFTREGLLKKYKFYKGDHVDILMYGLSNEN